MQIRSASRDDAEGMSRVLRDIIAVTGHDRPCDTGFVIARYIANPDSVRCNVAVDAEGEVLGFQSLLRGVAGNPCDVPEGWGIIGTHIGPCVDRCGVGTALFASSSVAAAQAGVARIDACIAADDVDESAYYDAMGFRTYRALPGIVQKLFVVAGDDRDVREHPCAAVPVPPGMAAEVAGYRGARDTVGESGGAVYRLFGTPGSPDLYLKHGADAVADDVTDEMARLRWLHAYLPVPMVTHFVGTPREAWLLTTALPGRTAYQLLAANPDAGTGIVDALASFLRRLHAIPAHECPFNSDHRLRLSRARTRIDAGLVEVEDFDEARQGWTAEQVWDAMQPLLPLLPLDPDPVVTHGDFSLDNILIDAGEVVGCIDLGRVGIADRYQDLAILWNSLGEFGPVLQDQFFRRYGIADPDDAKLRFHLMLDELF